MKDLTKKQKIMLIVGIVVFIITIIVQAVTSRQIAQAAAMAAQSGKPVNASANSINGIIMQVQVLDTVLLTVLVAKTGFITSLILNGLNFLYTLVVVVLLMKNYNSMPGVICPLITIITCCIIHTYSDKVVQASNELKEKNRELTETNKIIREKDEKLIYLAYYDVLTGLANRQLFVEQIDEMINTNANEPFTVVLADIDDFKRIIDAYGHNIGDVLLSTYADRLREYCAQNDFIAKFGEEEFAVIIKGASDNQDTIEYINNLRIALCAPVVVSDTPLQLTMSFGVSEYPANGANSAEILRNTDIAVTNAKMTGRGCIFFLNQNQYM